MRSVAIDNNYVPVSYLNPTVDTTFEASTLSTTDAYGRFNTTTIPASTTYAAVLRVVPATNLTANVTTEPLVVAVRMSPRATQMSVRPAPFPALMAPLTPAAAPHLRSCARAQGSTGTCYDGGSLLRLDTYLSSPLDYTSISAISTIVVELMAGWSLTQAQAEARVISALGLTGNLPAPLAAINIYQRFNLGKQAS